VTSGEESSVNVGFIGLGAMGWPMTRNLLAAGHSVAVASQMVAVSEATALATKSGVELAKLHEVLVHSTGDCTAVRTRLPAPGVIADSPASNGWKPDFMTDLMAKDIGLALGYAAMSGVAMPATALARQVLAAASVAGYGREDFSALAKVVLAQAGVAIDQA
jgi:3-hydroxyisobutyrate dehydrogenase-like beta-hydroxyacid dehydrogenase